MAIPDRGAPAATAHTSLAPTESGLIISNLNLMKLSPTLNLTERARFLKLRPLPPPERVEAEQERPRPSCHPVWLGTQLLPYSVVLNAQKTPRDIYDD